MWDEKWMRNKLLPLHFFSTFLNPQRATLTYSAMMAALYLSGSPDNFILKQKPNRNSAFPFQGTSGEEFRRMRSASCERAVPLE